MSPLLVPFDDEILAHVANYWAFDDWEEVDYDREFAESSRRYWLDPADPLPAC